MQFNSYQLRPSSSSSFVLHFFFIEVFFFKIFPSITCLVACLWRKSASLNHLLIWGGPNFGDWNPFLCGKPMALWEVPHNFPPMDEPNCLMGRLISMVGWDCTVSSDDLDWKSDGNLVWAMPDGLLLYDGAIRLTSNFAALWDPLLTLLTSTTKKNWQFLRLNFDLIFQWMLLASIWSDCKGELWIGSGGWQFKHSCKVLASQVSFKISSSWDLQSRVSSLNLYLIF